MTTSIDQIQAEAVSAQRVLAESGWTVVNGPGDMASPDGIVWFSIGYTNGEYTLSCWTRKNGAGPAEGTTRVRVTNSTISSYSNIGSALAADLAAWASERSDLGDLEVVSWPPAAWAELAVAY